MRRGITLIEVLVAAAVLVVLTLPLIDMISENARAVASLTRRVVLELRARRHQTEAASTTYAALMSAGGELPVSLAEPVSAESYFEHVHAVDESCEVREVSGGLAEIRARVSWVPQSGGPREVLSRRLLCDPTYALRLAYPMMVAER